MVQIISIMSYSHAHSHFYTFLDLNDSLNGRLSTMTERYGQPPPYSDTLMMVHTLQTYPLAWHHSKTLYHTSAMEQPSTS